MDVRARHAVPLVEQPGYRYRQYLGAFSTASDIFSAEHVGYSALRVLDDVSVDPGARASFVPMTALRRTSTCSRGRAKWRMTAMPP